LKIWRINIFFTSDTDEREQRIALGVGLVPRPSDAGLLSR
jgi:hypothetical protein